MGGKAEPIRLLCFYCKISFIDERYNFEEFRAAKTSLPFSQLPVLTVDKTIIPQTNAILRYVARLSRDDSLYPVSDIGRAAILDGLLDLDADLFTGS